MEIDLEYGNLTEVQKYTISMFIRYYINYIKQEWAQYKDTVLGPYKIPL